MAQQKTTIKISPKYNKEERAAIAQEIVDYIVERTLKGKDKNNRNFKGYSGEYKDSLDFKIAGKSPSNVNLKLSGDMLADIQVLNERKGSITIGFEKGTESNDKAEGNIKGTYGSTRKTKKDPTTGKRVARDIKKRDFLGISNRDLRSKVLSNFPLTDKDKRLEQTAAVLEAIFRAREENVE